MHTQALFDNIPQHIIAELNKATHSIVIAVAWFTRADILPYYYKKPVQALAFSLPYPMTVSIKMKSPLTKMN